MSWVRNSRLLGKLSRAWGHPKTAPHRTLIRSFHAQTVLAEGRTFGGATPKNAAHKCQIHINRRILQTVVSEILLVLGLRTRM